MAKKNVVIDRMRQLIPRALRLGLSDYFLSLTGGYSVQSFSQEGEDRILLRYLAGREGGFYIDVGAHHPHRYSNTYLFYRMGWSGVNIDARPGSMNAFKKFRPRDINIECGISNEEAVLDYYVFNEQALNGFDIKLSIEREEKYEQFYITDSLQVPVRPLSSVLKEYVPSYQKIDFLSIDVEGLDYEVLLSNDWAAFRPEFVLVEILKTDIVSFQASKTAKFMSKLGYVLVAKTYNTYFFRDSALG